jgi:hypothetical protein
MKSPRFFLLLLIPVLLAGCETINSRDREVLRDHNVPQDVFDKMLYGDPLSLDDVITLSQRGVPPGLIIHYIDETDTAYRLRKADVKQLRSAGVSEQVISYMLSTCPPYGPVGYPGGYPYPPPYPYPYGPYYYGADYYGPVVVVGGGYGRGGWGRGGWGRGGWGRGGWGGHR